MLKFTFETTGPKFQLDEAVHYVHDGVDVLLRIARVIVEGRWRSVYDLGPLDGEEGPPSVDPSPVIEHAYIARVLNVNDAGGRSLRPGQLVSFHRGQTAIATVQEFETHGRAIDGLPSDHKIRGDERRMQLLTRAAEDVRAKFLIARQSGVFFPAVQVVEMDPAGFFKIGPRGVELDGFDVGHYSIPIETRSNFVGGVPDGHIPVVLVTPGDGITCVTLPLEE
jgi:hypothetical protein